MNLLASPPRAHEERWYQTEAEQSIWNYFDGGGKGNPAIALPTGAGKTHVIVNFIKNVMQRFRGQRFHVTTHVKELIEQNANKFAEAWPYAPYGIHSASLNARDFQQPIIFGGIQSMVKRLELFTSLTVPNLVFIDEAHLIPPSDESNYQTYIKHLRSINPYVKFIGLSATLFRQGQGMITDEHEGQIFTDIIYNLCTIEGYARLIAEGYLSPLIPKRTSIEIDTSQVLLGANGDFNQKQLQEAANRERITHAALTEACHYGYNRRSWLAFASGIEHAENIANMLNSFGVPSAVVHSKLKDKDERDKRIKAHKNGEIRCLVGNNIFTTGYDHPPLDFIIDLQPTMSVAKHVQKYGRGMRPSRETYKENCLILDFGGNVRRCGPINDPYIPKRKGKGGGDAPVKICDNCGTYNHAAARFCDGCGEPFEFDTKIIKSASEVEILKSDLPITETFPVDRVFYWKHISRRTGIPALVCSYFSGLSKYDEWVNIENPKAKHFAHEWFRARTADEIPETVDEALAITDKLRVPRYIRVWVNREKPQVVGVEW